MGRIGVQVRPAIEKIRSVFIPKTHFKRRRVFINMELVAELAEVETPPFVLVPVLDEIGLGELDTDGFRRALNINRGSD